MENQTVLLDAEKQTQAKQYSRIKRRLWVVDTLIGLAYASMFLGFGWAISLRASLTTLITEHWSLNIDYILPPVFALVYGLVIAIPTFPLSYYSGFVLPHRFGQSNQSLKDWLLDNVKGVAIAAPLGLILIEIIFMLLRAYPQTWWLWLAGVLLILNVVLANLAPVLIMPMFNKYVPLGDEHADLAARLMKLAEHAHTKVRGVFKFDMSKRTNAANAALTGIGSTRRIVLGDTLIQEFTPDEIETVLAHELGHHVNRDIPLLMAFGTLSTLLSFYLASLGLNWCVIYFGFNGSADPAAFPALTLILTLYGLLSMPLDNAFSRWRERLADRYSLKATRQPEAFASAMTRLANQNLAEVDPERWVVLLFHSHPPLEERIAAARAWRG